MNEQNTLENVFFMLLYIKKNLVRRASGIGKTLFYFYLSLSPPGRYIEVFKSSQQEANMEARGLKSDNGPPFNGNDFKVANVSTSFIYLSSSVATESILHPQFYCSITMNVLVKLCVWRWIKMSYFLLLISTLHYPVFHYPYSFYIYASVSSLKSE